MADTKTSNGLSSFMRVTTPEIVFDESPVTTVVKAQSLGDLPVPTPEQAIDQIINALFRSEPDFVLPVGAKQAPGSISEDSARPMSKSDSDEKSSPPSSDSETKPESMSSDDEPSSEPSGDDEAVGAILRGWANEAGWCDSDFLTRGSGTVIVQPRHGSRVAALAGALLSGVVTKSWTRDDRESWRDSLSLTAWRTRFERLRRRAR